MQLSGLKFCCRITAVSINNINTDNASPDNVGTHRDQIIIHADGAPRQLAGLAR